MLYLISNGAMQTTAAPVAVTTGTVIKTMLQLKPLTGAFVRIVEWGLSFDGSSAATPIKVELIETDVAATVTASASADITKLDDPNAPAPETAGVSLGTSATGYTASAEGTTAALRNLDGPKFIAPTNQYEKQFPLGYRPTVNISKFCRIRVTAGAAVNMYCYIIYEI